MFWAGGFVIGGGTEGGSGGLLRVVSGFWQKKGMRGAQKEASALSREGWLMGRKIKKGFLSF